MRLWRLGIAVLDLYAQAIPSKGPEIVNHLTSIRSPRTAQPTAQHSKRFGGWCVMGGLRFRRKPRG